MLAAMLGTASGWAAGAPVVLRLRNGDNPQPARASETQREASRESVPVLRIVQDGLSGSPVVRVRQGDAAAIRVVNEAATPLTLHWHGVRVPNAMDGAAPLTQKPIAPSALFDYTFVPPDAGTFLIRPSPWSAAANAAGVLIVDGKDAGAADRDAVILLNEQDKSPQTIVAQRHQRVRLRLVNGSLKPVGLRTALHVTIGAIDGQPCEPFAPRNGVVALAPGNRMDAFLDVTLEAGATSPLLSEAATGAAVATLACEKGDAARAAPRESAVNLPLNPLPQQMNFSGALRTEIDLAAPVSDRSLLSAKRGRTVMLALRNPSGGPFAVHLHGHSTRLLDRLDDGWKPFWLDTFFVPAGQTARVAFVADNPGKWALDILSPAEPAAARMAWFEVA